MISTWGGSEGSLGRHGTINHAMGGDVAWTATGALVLGVPTGILATGLAGNLSKGLLFLSGEPVVGSNIICIKFGTAPSATVNAPGWIPLQTSDTSGPLYAVIPVTVLHPSFRLLAVVAGVTNLYYRFVATG